MTLDLRVKRAAENGMKVAKFLHEHPAVKKVYYPGLKDHPGHDIAAKQMKAFGSMISFDVDGLEKAKRVLDNCKLIALAVSLGGCESLIQHPASMTHAGVPKKERESACLTDNLIRISVGIEDADDIIADLKQALDTAI
jgi:cystathionine beta-lyase/cystathionine gamma-synthase